MNASVLWVLVALAAAGGCLVVGATSPTRLVRPPLAARIDPVVRQRGMLVRAGALLGRHVGDGVELDRLLARAGRPATAPAYGVERATWALVWAAVAVATGAVLALRRGSVSGWAVAVVVVALAPCGIVLCDRRLRAAGNARMAALRQELPAAADLMALAVTAGDGLHAALARVAAAAPGPCGVELGRVSADCAAGVSLSVALDDCAERLGEAGLQRFGDAITAAATGGAPLADALGALAADIREQTRAQMFAEAGRRQVAMLVPVVTFILPAALLFAFFPALEALGDLAR